MFDVKMKVFRDSVHGYIQVPQIIVSNIIDSELFQRLRYVEQTSMRTLYPAARHDRFIHSLGVYALGIRAFLSFQKNIKFNYKDMLELNKIDDAWWKKNYMLFSLACLLHDCAHAPFSHTLEFIYEIINVNRDAAKDVIKNSKFKKRINVLSKLNYEMMLTYKSRQFEHDYFINGAPFQGIGAPHEKLSAILVSREYAEAINIISMELIKENITEEDLEFIARAIIGCTYKKVFSPAYSLKNCIISMLNSSAIDVDGLDYIVRDAYNSGMDSWSIDYQRIIESFTITEITVFENVSVKNLNISGIWSANSVFQNERWIDGSVEGVFGFAKFNPKDVSGISFVTNLELKDGDHNAFNNIVTSHSSKSKAIISRGNIKFDLTLSKSCRLDGNLTGNISGRFLGKMNDSAARYATRIEYEIAYNKTSMSVIQSAIDARNHEYLWVYSHPKVVYNSTFLQIHLLRLSAKFMCCKKNNSDFKNQKIDFTKCNKCIISHETEEEIIHEILGLNSFFMGKNTTGKFEDIGYRFYRSCDDDLISLFKNIYYENAKYGLNASDEINEYFSSYFSRHHKKPVWKSFIEFEHFFSAYKQKELISGDSLINNTSAYRNYYGFLNKDAQNELQKHGINKVVLVKSKLSTKELDSNSTYLIFDKTTVRLCDVLDKSILKSKYEKEFFYLFGDMKESIGYSQILPVIETLNNISINKMLADDMLADDMLADVDNSEKVI